MTQGEGSTGEKQAQAEALLRANRLHEARDLYQDVCDLEPDNADLWLRLGAINGQLADPAAAEACIRNALALRPDMAAAHFNLGIALRDQKRPGKAVKAFQAAIEINPDYAEAHNAMGYVLAVRGEIPAAERCFRQAIGLDPRLADAYTNLGNVLRAQSRRDDAVVVYRKALAVQPDNLDALLNLTSLLSTLNRFDEAINYGRRILALRPDFAQAHYHLGNTLIGANRLEEAVECLRSAQRVKPDFIEATGLEAQALQKLGRYEEAAECLLAALDRGVRSAAIIVALAAVAKRLERREQAISLAEDLLAEGKLSDDDKQQLHFAAGKLHDELERYQEAFEHYRRANALYRGRFSRAQLGQVVDASIALFQRHRMSTLPKSRSRSDRPIFIIGMPRSGTSLVEQILASHPSVFGAGELNDINQYANGMQVRLGSALPYPACLGEMPPDLPETLAGQYLDRLRALDPSALRVVDKMPHNFLHLGLIALLFPGARIIHIRRDPMDTCLSIYFQRFNDLHAYAHDLSDLGYYYSAYERLMTHWRSVLELPLLEIRYEDLVAEPHTWIPRLVEFCGLEWDEKCMRFHETRRVVNTPSTEQVREPLYSRSVGRWRHYAEQLEPLRSWLEKGREPASGLA